MNERLPKFKGEKLLEKIAELTRGLTYISETDAEIKPYDENGADRLGVKYFSSAKSSQQIPAGEFFRRLTDERELFGPTEKEKAKRFAELQKLLEENLSDLRVFKIGRIQIDIYVVGLDIDNELIGIKTKAVET